MERYYKRPFKVFLKKQHKPLQLAIEDAVDDICENPSIGEAKTGDLHGISVYKFAHKSQEYLVAYRLPKQEDHVVDNVKIELLTIDFYQVGLHESFYTELKRYLKS